MFYFIRSVIEKSRNTMEEERNKKEEELNKFFPNLYISLICANRKYHTNGKIMEEYCLPLLQIILEKKYPRGETSWIGNELLIFRFCRTSQSKSCKKELKFTSNGRFYLDNFNTFIELKKYLADFLALCELANVKNGR